MIREVRQWARTSKVEFSAGRTGSAIGRRCAAASTCSPACCSESKFDFERPLTGLEIEFNLVDDASDPAMRNAEVLDAIANDDFQTELGQFNIEINVPPRGLAQAARRDLEAELRASLNDAEARARAVGAHIVMIGILPTLTPEHLTDDVAERQPALPAHQRADLRRARRGPAHRHRRAGAARRHTPTRSRRRPPAPASSSTCRSARRTTPAYWNAAQCIAGVQLALGANSPFLFGKELWRETRVALFEQATDTRPEELKEQGVRPRVWFGERWITSIFDQFEENVRYFPALLPVTDDEDPVAGARAAATRRACRAAAAQRHDLPLEPPGLRHLSTAGRTCASRTACCPPGPTVVDTLANGAFYYGLVRDARRAGPAACGRRCRSRAAEDNFDAGARRGIDAQLYWPGLGEVPATELVLRRLLPLAHEGLAAWGVDTAISDRLLGIIEQRCTTLQNGAEWQVRTFHRIDEHKRPLDRRDALREMLRRYVELMHTNEPVHTWPVE